MLVVQPGIRRGFTIPKGRSYESRVYITSWESHVTTCWDESGVVWRRPFNAAIAEQTSLAVPAASPARHGLQARTSEQSDLNVPGSGRKADLGSI